MKHCILQVLELTENVNSKIFCVCDKDEIIVIEVEKEGKS